MQTKTIKLEHDMDKTTKALEQCAAAIKKGGLIAFPTETSYGLGCDATNSAALKKIYAIKGRDEDKPLPIIVSDLRMAEDYCVLDDRARKLAHSFMPGPLTLVVEKKNTLPDELTTKEKGVAFRISSRDFARLLVQEAQVPIVSTSANLSGKMPIYKADELKETFMGKIEVIIDAGNLPPIRPSTIIDMRSKTPVVLREGPLHSGDVLRELNE